MTTIKMTALRTITASQSPTGKGVKRGETYDADPVTAGVHERAGLSKPAAAADKAPAKGA